MFELHLQIDNRRVALRFDTTQELYRAAGNYEQLNVTLYSRDCVAEVWLAKYDPIQHQWIELSI